MTALKRVIVGCAIVLGAMAACSGATKYASPPQSVTGGSSSPQVSPTPAYQYLSH